MPLLRDRTAWLQGGKALCMQPPPTVRRPWRLVLLGPPGVGKGTQARLLSQALGGCPLSTGDIFRAAHSYRMPPGLDVAYERMVHGELVPDDFVLSVVGERQRCLHCRGGFMLDGFPRTLRQAVSLDGLLAAHRVRLDAVLSYELPESELASRIAGRRACPRCHAVYHVEHHPPMLDGICDHCGGTLERQCDDQPAAVQARLDAYLEVTAAVAEHYRHQDLLISIAANDEPAEILAHTLDALAERCVPVA